jgi:hypothetical protein
MQDDYGFGYLDGKQWEQFVVKFSPPLSSLSSLLCLPAFVPLVPYHTLSCVPCRARKRSLSHNPHTHAKQECRARTARQSDTQRRRTGTLTDGQTRGNNTLMVCGCAGVWCAVAHCVGGCGVLWDAGRYGISTRVLPRLLIMDLDREYYLPVPVDIKVLAPPLCLSLCLPLASPCAFPFASPCTGRVECRQTGHWFLCLRGASHTDNSETRRPLALRCS